jgi:hypothetical protein
MTSPALKWSLCVTGGLVHSTACVDRDALDSLGRYAETPVSADLRLWLSLARCGWLGVMPTPTVLWRRHPTQIGAQRIALQREVSARWIQAHLAAITGVPWTYEDAWNLWGTGRWQSVPLAAGISVLDRWHDSWTSDTSLTAPERSDLARLTRRVRLRHLRYNRRAGLGAAVAALTRTVRRLPQGARSARVGR